LINEATASWLGATVVGGLTGESGNLEILSGSSVNNFGSGVSTELGTYGGSTVRTGKGYIGLNAGSSGSVLVSGVNSEWTNYSTLRVGHYGTGELIIENGGSVSHTTSNIGSSSSGNGTAIVTGTGSTWTNSSGLVIGSTGTGALLIENGGSVSNNHGYIGNNTDSSGTVTVTGIGSTWTNNGTLWVGSSGTGELTVENGGVVTTRTLVASLANLHGNGTIHANSLIVDGIDLTFDSPASLEQSFSFGSGGQIHLDFNGTGALGAGHQGTGSLTISNGMQIFSTQVAYVGRMTASEGAVTVTGEDSAATRARSTSRPAARSIPNTSTPPEAATSTGPAARSTSRAYSPAA